MELELRHLATIRAIADAGSLTEAAAVLGLARPALSARLRRIESDLGGRLFDRGRHGVRTTPLGELVLARARIVPPAVGEPQQDTDPSARTLEEDHRFRLGGTHGPLLGGLADRLVAAHPGLPVTTYTSWSEREIAASLAEGRIDYALIGCCGASPPPAGERLEWREVASDPVLVMLAAGHPLAGHQEIGLAELADETWTDEPGDDCFGDCFTAACAHAGFTPTSVHGTDTASRVRLVRDGRAVGLCRATFPATAGLVTRPLAGTPLSWRHLLGWHAEARAADGAAAVLEQARAAHARSAARSESHADWLDGGHGPLASLPPGSIHDAGRDP